MGFFLPLATAYRKNLEEFMCFATEYSMNKVDFLDLYQDARDTVSTVKNIQHSWTNSELLPLNPELILQKLSKKRSINSSEIIFRDSDKITTTVSLTLETVEQVNNMLQQYWEGNKDSKIIDKLGKAALMAITQSQLLKITNHELLKSNKRKH